jgi:hypothetical protein
VEDVRRFRRKFCELDGGTGSYMSQSQQRAKHVKTNQKLPCRYGDLGVGFKLHVVFHEKVAVLAHRCFVTSRRSRKSKRSWHRKTRNGITMLLRLGGSDIGIDNVTAFD